MEELVKFSPATLTFSVSLGKQNTTNLSLANISGDVVAYKVKTTHIKRYCVRPNAALLKPGEEIDVELVQQAFRSVPPDLNDCRDRFLLQAVALSDVPGLTDNVTVADVWEKAGAESIRKTKFSVRLQLKGAADETSSAVSKVVASTGGLTPIPEEAAIENVEETAVETLADTPPPQLPFSSPGAVVEPRASEPDTHSHTHTPVETLTMASNPPPASRIASASATEAPPFTASAHTAASVASEPAAAAEVDPPPASEVEPAAVPPPAVAPAPLQPASKASPAGEQEVDYKSVAFARSRALGVRPAPRVEPPTLDRAARQRIAVERAGELVRVINLRQKDIELVRQELAEARHKLSDAQMATRPAYDVRYEVNESARIPFAQICIMAIISGALLQLLV